MKKGQTFSISNLDFGIFDALQKATFDAKVLSKVRQSAVSKKFSS